MAFPSSSRLSSTRLLSGLCEVSASYDVILCDIWGVVHDGEQHFAAAADALTRFRRGGGRVVLITNAPRPAGPIRDQLDAMQVPRSAYDALVTSGDVTMQLIMERGRDRPHHIGPPRDLALFDEIEALTGQPVNLAPISAADYVVCTGLFDDDVETPADYASTLMAMRNRGLSMISANPDIVVHRGTTLLYCAGALAQAYANIGGQVLQAGKPYAPIYQQALALAGTVAQSRILAIGDALATDMRGAELAGIDGLFITHGIHRNDLHQDGSTKLTQTALDGFFKTSTSPPRHAMASLCW